MITQTGQRTAGNLPAPGTVRAYTVTQVAELLQISYEQVRLMCVSGELASFRAGRYIRIPVAAVDELERTPLASTG